MNLYTKNNRLDIWQIPLHTVGKLNRFLRGRVKFPTDGDNVFTFKSVTRVCGGCSVNLQPTVKVWMGEEKSLRLLGVLFS